VGALFEELDRRTTPLGEISLRRRRDLTLDVEVFEAKLDDEFLMSSLFTVAEIALADLGLAAVGGDALDVVVGGLGLGYTAQAALADDRVRSLHVVEGLDEVIDWHRRGLLPLSESLTDDERCHLHHGDFFALVRAGAGFGRAVPERVHAVLVDIDHSPVWVLHPSHADLYTPVGLRRLADLLHPDGVFALWSDAPPDHAFLTSLGAVFARCEATVVPFTNPSTGGTSSNTVYVASLPR
jgi:spermidine synthase